MILTDGVETFIAVRRGDHATDYDGFGYTRCAIGACDHSDAPDGAVVWHDDEHSETLWEMSKTSTSLSLTGRYSEEDLFEMCESRQGTAIAEQLQHIMDGDRIEDQNPNAVRVIIGFLERKCEKYAADAIRRENW